MKERPAGITKRDILVGVLVASIMPAFGVAEAVELSSAACEPLFKSIPPGERWYPMIDATHCRLAIRYAARAHRYGVLTKEEYDYVCEKARRRLLTLESDGA